MWPTAAPITNVTDYVPVFETLNHWSKEVQVEWRRFLHIDDACKLTSFVRDISVTMIYYFTSIFPRVTVQWRKYPENLVFGKMPSPSFFLTVLHIYKDLLNTQNVWTEMKLISRHFHQALELSRAEHKKENDSFSVSDIDEIQLKYSTLNLLSRAEKN